MRVFSIVMYYCLKVSVRSNPQLLFLFFLFEDYIDRGFGLSASSSSSSSVGPPSGKGRMGYIHTYIHTHTRIYIHRALTVYVEIRSGTY